MSVHKTVSEFFEGTALDFQRMLRRERLLLIRAIPVLNGYKFLAVSQPEEK